jgi:hypothetical protein
MSFTWKKTRVEYLVCFPVLTEAFSFPFTTRVIGAHFILRLTCTKILPERLVPAQWLSPLSGAWRRMEQVTAFPIMFKRYFCYFS